ncbi:class I SAM-dependent methyltransferase, partial [bacterium]|nr:class I SAM-dependent methyltransferase [bacterium]
MNDLKHILPGEPIPRGSLFHERRFRVAMRYTSQLQRGGTLLDIGCGNGSQTEFFAQHVTSAYGLDLQVTRLPGFKRQIEQNCNNLTIMGGNGEQVPFKDESFDYVTCFEVIEHVVDQHRALQEIYR